MNTDSRNPVVYPFSSRLDSSNDISSKLTRGWRLRHRRPDPEAQLKVLNTTQSSGFVKRDGQVNPVTPDSDLKQQYNEFQQDFQSELEARKLSDGWDQAKLQYLTDRYVRHTYPISDPSDATYGSHGYIVHFKHGITDVVENKLPIRGMTLSIDSFIEAEANWQRQQGTQDNQTTASSDVRWIHLPANNMMWVQQTMLNILEFYHISEPGQTVSGTRAREIRDNILQRDYWKNRETHSLDGKLWGRYMKPFSRCIGSPAGAAEVSPTLNTPTLALYMPYLHWERNAAAAYMRNVAQDVYDHYPISYRFEPDTATGLIAQLGEYGASPDEQLMRRYVRYRQPLHIRHTLDQFFQPYLRDFSERDFDQVTERYSKRNNLESFEEFKDESPMLMVDQLWIWVIGGKTILTCFPTTWGMDSGTPDPLDLRSKIMYNLKKAINQSCYDSAPAMANLIISQCAANMLEPTMLVHERHKFLSFYDQSITILSERQMKSLKALLCMSTPDRLDAHEKLLDTTTEFSMLAEGRDIEEELKIIRSVLDLQEDALRQLNRAITKFQLAIPATDTYPMGRIMLGLQTRQQAIDRLSKGAQTVNDQILQLLSLKQQQASISEARSSRMLAEQGDRQSASMMLFTVVTILFLPLSTLTSFFGMNSVEMGSGTIPLGKVTAYVFPISAVCVGISFFLGFNHLARRTLLMWLDYIAESLTGPDRNHFWAAREKNISARLKKKRKQKRVALIKSRIRRAKAIAQAQELDSSSDESEAREQRNPYRSTMSLRSSEKSDDALDDNLIDYRIPRDRTGSHSTSHVYNSGPDTEEDVSDRPMTPLSRPSTSRSPRPSMPSNSRPLFRSDLVHHPDNESAVLVDEHHEPVPPITVHGPDLRHTIQTQPGSYDQSLLPSRAISPGSRPSRLRESTVLRAANQASQVYRPTTSPRNSVTEVLTVQTGQDRNQNNSGEVIGVKRPRTSSA